MRKLEDVPRSQCLFFPVGAKEGGRELFDDPSYVNVDKPRPPVAANGNAHRDAFDMSKCLIRSIFVVLINKAKMDCSKKTTEVVQKNK